MASAHVVRLDAVEFTGPVQDPTIALVGHSEVMLTPFDSDPARSPLAITRDVHHPIRVGVGVCPVETLVKLLCPGEQLLVDRHIAPPRTVVEPLVVIVNIQLRGRQHLIGARERRHDPCNVSTGVAPIDRSEPLHRQIVTGQRQRNGVRPLVRGTEHQQAPAGCMI